MKSANTKIQYGEKGYTMIEMMVVIIIVGIVLPLVFSILYTIIQQQLKINRIVEVKKQGDYVLAFMKNKIESDAIRISSSTALADEKCTTTSPTYSSANGSFYFMNKLNQAFIYDASSGQLIQTNTATNLQTSLTTGKVVVKNLTFKCIKRSTLGSPLVQISFTVEYNNTTPNPRPEEIAILSYKTKLRLNSN